MRIGELAAAVGVTTRTVRHYHHLGLLPEPDRRPNGYRDYGLRHAVVLARIRRLTELGLGLAEVRDVLADDEGRDLAEVRDVLADDEGRDLAEVLAELDEDLARQEAAIRERRARLRLLLERGRPGEDPVSPELAALFAGMERFLDSPMAAKDREVLALIETAAGPEERKRLAAALGEAFGDPAAVEQAQDVYALLDALVDAGVDDPRVEEAARAVEACLPDGLVPEEGVDDDHAFLHALYADMSPAQAEAVRRALRMHLRGRR
ncbi:MULTISPECIES: MerR family transcriptional regulator [unclassified Streptomyces]|uniref:MerR family transcriptional regulator n=1 Tax=unclassified Streptomyces TaxID=2593676 RepID=UPI003D8E89B6